jgi:hypothetical protein
MAGRCSDPDAFSKNLFRNLEGFEEEISEIGFLRLSSAQAVNTRGSVMTAVVITAGVQNRIRHFALQCSSLRNLRMAALLHEIMSMRRIIGLE